MLRWVYFVGLAGNLLAGEHYLTGAEQAYNLDTFSFAYQKQTGLMLYHPPTALALKPTRRMGSPGFQARHTGRPGRTLLTLPTAEDARGAADGAAGGAANGAAGGGAAAAGGVTTGIVPPVGTTQRSLSLALQQASASGISNLVDAMEHTTTGMRRHLGQASLAIEQMSSTMVNRDAAGFQRAAANATDALDQVNTARHGITANYYQVVAGETAATQAHRTRATELVDIANDLVISADALQLTYDAAIRQANNIAETERQNRLNRMQSELADLQRTQEQQRAQQRAQRALEQQEHEQRELAQQQEQGGREQQERVQPAVDEEMAATTDEEMAAPA
ncbi:hypothetical protein CHLRE_15g642950v5 [Chlamydomonas reinhardtii]|uniref:Uncharacterized protein n=1 Tax=Chlamydomonas reinhardtii TaxID=3055 RepID=A0A2K3CX14_CHLRE|nr:uncharacterized protein CHLRE_15g642950v5 [Chlamydomonas reinhardtii]PNW72825.1 hypothetical protein CHLRE_15g642950v5 [Chlamydomonas reinhardtii]